MIFNDWTFQSDIDLLDCEQSLFSQSSLRLAGLAPFAWFPCSCDHPEGLLAVYPACTKVTAVTTSMRSKRVFSSVQTCILVDVNQQLSWFLTHLSREDSFPISRALGRACQHLSHFCNTLLQDLTQLHVKITRSTKLLSFCWRKFKLSTYLRT